MRSIFPWLGLAITATVAGCASVPNQTADKSTLQALAGQTVSYTLLPPVSFALSTPENNKSILRTAQWTADGAQLVGENKVEDPAVAIGRNIAASLAQAYSMRVVPAAEGSARVGIEVKTTNWGLFFTSADEGRFGVVYTATVRLIDLQKNSVIASGYCKPGPDVFSRARPRAEMLNNGAAGVKAGLNTSAAECVEFITRQALGL